MKNAKWLRVALWVLLGLFLLDLGWFFGMRSYLRSESFLKLVNTPELQFDAEDGYSPWPGYFIFHKFAFSGFSEQATYRIKADSIAFHLNPFLLFQQQVAIRALTIQDVSIIVGQGPDSKKGVEKKEGQVQKQEEELATKKDGEAPYWTISFDHAVMHDVQEFRIRNWAFLGKADIEASFWLDTKGLFQLEDSRVKMRDVKVLRGEEALGTLSKATLTSDIQKFRMDGEELSSFLPKIRTHWQLAGRLDHMDTIGEYLRDLKWLKLKGSALKVEGDVAMRDAHWQDGSQLKFATDALQVKLLRQAIDGSASFAWQVKKDGPNQLELNFGKYLLNEGRDGEGEGFRLTLDTPDKKVDQKFASWTADIDLPPTRIHRLQFLQAFIPPSLPLDLEKGRGSVEGKFKAGSETKGTGGYLNVDVKDMSLRYKKDLSFQGAVKAKTVLTRLDLEKSEFDIKDSGIEIEGLSFLDKKGWNGSLHMRNARLKIEKPVFLKSEVQVEGDNLQPVLAFLVKDRSFPAWVIKAFDLKAPKVNFLFDATEDNLKIDKFDAKAGELAIEGWFNGNAKDSRARFFFQYAGISGGYGWEGDKSEWKLTGAEDWFKAKRF